MSTQSVATSTAAPPTAAPTTIASGFTTVHPNKSSEDLSLDASFVWSVEELEDCGEIRVSVRYGGGPDISNFFEEHIRWGDTSTHPFGPGRNTEVWVKGNVSVVWGNPDQTTKKKSFVVLFSGFMMILNASNKNGILSSDKYSGAGRQNQIIVYAHLT